jgi:hypothetical protein
MISGENDALIPSWNFETHKATGTTTSSYIFSIALRNATVTERYIQNPLSHMIREFHLAIREFTSGRQL